MKLNRRDRKKFVFKNIILSIKKVTHKALEFQTVLSKAKIYCLLRHYSICIYMYLYYIYIFIQIFIYICIFIRTYRNVYIRCASNYDQSTLIPIKTSFHACRTNPINSPIILLFISALFIHHNKIVCFVFIKIIFIYLFLHFNI